jgi:chemotaxis protein histidine kinase CheA
MADDKAKVFQPPNMLRAKVGNKPGPNLDQMVAAAQTALSEMKEDFESWIRDDLLSLKESVAALHRAADPAVLARIKMQAHEIKGQGATYGYPLLTTAGDLLHLFIDKNPEVAAQNLDIIDAHVDFMTLVLSQGLRDQGDAMAQGILTGLQTAAKKAHGGTTARSAG